MGSNIHENQQEYAECQLQQLFIALAAAADRGGMRIDARISYRFLQNHTLGGLGPLLLSGWTAALIERDDCFW